MLINQELDRRTASLYFKNNALNLQLNASTQYFNELEY